MGVSLPTSNIPRLSIGGGLNKTLPILPVRTQFRFRPPNPKQLITMSAHSQRSFTKCSALSVRCGGAEQTQTKAREAQTMNKAPTHIKEKTPRLDDGGSGFPPLFGSGGGGGGGGGGGESRGGGILFCFLVFMDLLKDIEADYIKKHQSRRRRR